MYPASAIANHLIQLAELRGVPLQGAQLQTLVYLAHGLRLAMMSEALLDAPVFANQEGVVIAALNVNGVLGEAPVTRPITEIVQRPHGLLDEVVPVLRPDDPVHATIEETWSRFGGWSASALRNFVQTPGGPWNDTWNSPERLMGRYNTTLTLAWHLPPEPERPVVIANSLIRSWFRDFVIQNLRSRAAADGLEETTRISSYRA